MARVIWSLSMTGKNLKNSVLRVSETLSSDKWGTVFSLTSVLYEHTFAVEQYSFRDSPSLKKKPNAKDSVCTAENSTTKQRDQWRNATGRMQ